MKRLLMCILIISTVLSVCSCKVKPQSDDEIVKAAADLTEQQETTNTEEKNDIADNEAETPTNEQAEKAETTKVTLTDESEKYLKIIKDSDTTVTNNTKEQLPTSKDFEIDGKTVKLTFKEKTYITKLTFFRYDYTDAEGNIYYFHENDGFIGFYNPNRPDKSGSVAITEDEAMNIAKNYAGKLFASEFDKYTFWKTNIYDAYTVPVYRFVFSKKYGADNSLHGEICSIEVYENGTIKSCNIYGLYTFKEFDPSLVNGITKEAVDKALLDSLSTQYDNFDKYKISIEGYELLQYTKDKWVISLSASFEQKDRAPFADTYFLEIN